MTCKSVFCGFFEYDTPKIVHIKSRVVGIISRLVQLIILGYIIGYVIVYKKGYQDFCPVDSAITTKVKGVEYTNFSDAEFMPYITHHESYNRIWDVSDYVVPPSENGAFFVTTNLVITPNQTRSKCPESLSVKEAYCENKTCTAGETLLLGNGQMTGQCVWSAFNVTHICEIEGWCPTEEGDVPINGSSLLTGTSNFTVLIKNFVDFPKFKIRRRNILYTNNANYLQNCTYDPVNYPQCPVFKLQDIVSGAGEDYNKMALKGGVMAIVIKWDCNFDLNLDRCIPQYEFRRLDDQNSILAPGFNFRYAHYYNDNRRTLFKAYGIKFVIMVQGQGGKFSIVPLMLNVGSGFGLLALEVVICDIVVLYLLKKRNYYKSSKYEQVDVEDDGFDPKALVPSFKRSNDENVVRDPSTYERFSDD